MGGRPLRLGEIAGVVGFVLACTLAIFFSWTRFGGELPLTPKGYRFTIAFPEARTLVANASVRIAGVPVGRVAEVKATEDRTLAIVELEPRYAPLPSDARAIVRTKTPLGESYIELTPGTRDAAKIPEGGTLDARNVRSAQQLEAVLGSFDKPTRKAFRTLVTDVRASLDGKAPDLNAALGASGPAIEDLGVLAQAIDAQSGDVRGLVSQTGAALRVISRRPDDLRGLVRGSAALLDATADSNRQLEATVRALVPFTGALRTTMPELDRTLRLAAPTLRTLRPVIPLLRPALRQADALAPVTARLFADLRPTLRSVRRASPAATRLLNAVRPLGEVLDENGREAVPGLQLAGAYKDDFVADFASGAAAFNYTKSAGDGRTSRYVRGALASVPELTVGVKERQASSRFNPYPAPNRTGNLKSIVCDQVDNAQSAIEQQQANQVPCVLDEPWSFRGKTRLFPDLSRFRLTELPDR